MNASELAMKMLEWEEKRRDLDELEDEIKSAVLEIGKTQTVGNVRASFFNGKKKFDYETPGRMADQMIINANIHQTVDWRQVCKEADIEPHLEGQGEPAVRVKLLE